MKYISSPLTTQYLRVGTTVFCKSLYISEQCFQLAYEIKCFPLA